MDSRKPENFSRPSRGTTGQSDTAKVAKAQPSLESNEFAEMLAALPDATPGDFHLGASNVSRPAAKSSKTIPSKAAVRKPDASSTPDLDDLRLEQTGEPVDSRSLSQQIMEHLEKHKIPAVSQLRIEVHDGVVVVAGEVPSAYEKQLVGHFCRQLPAVVKFVDAMVVRQADKPHKRPTRARRPARQSREWNLPFRVQHLGATLGLVVLVWGAISLGRGHGGPERLAVNPVAGELRFEGKPASGATIFLHPQDPSIPVRPRATVQADGTFEMTTYQPGDGAPAGRYKATIEWRRPVAGPTGDEDIPPNALPAPYASPQSTPVEVTIEEGENTFPPITFAN